MQEHWNIVGRQVGIAQVRGIVVDIAVQVQDIVVQDSCLAFDIGIGGMRVVLV
jgi:hypothetical protein